LAAVVLTGTTRFVVPRRLRRSILFLGAWLAVGLIASLLNAPEPSESLQILAWQAAAVATGLLASACLTAESTRQKVVLLYVHTTAIVVAISLGAYLFRFSHSGLLSEVEVFSGSRRLSGFAPEPNLFGSQCLFAFLLASLYPMHSKSLGRVRLLLLLGIGVSFTRAVWIATAIALIYIVLASRMSRRRDVSRRRPRGPRPRSVSRILLGLAVVFTALLAVSPAARSEAGSRLESLVNLDAGTGAYRVDTWRIAFEDLADKDAWIAGLGVNTFGQRHANPHDAEKPAYLGNSLLVQVYDTGVVGTLSFVLGLLSLARRSDDKRATTTILIAALLAGSGTSALWFGFLWVPLWLTATYRTPHQALTHSQINASDNASNLVLR